MFGRVGDVFSGLVIPHTAIVELDVDLRRAIDLKERLNPICVAIFPGAGGNDGDADDQKQKRITRPRSKINWRPPSGLLV